MYKKRFFFIAFEGIEGTGKSYQIHKLYKNLKKKSFEVIKTREPGGSKSAEIIRKLIFNRDFSKFDKKTDFYLMLAARNEHFINTIKKAIKKKVIVITDRFTDSTYVYQVLGSGVNKQINLQNKKYILGNFKPDLTIVLKSKLNTVFSRIAKRKNNNKFDKLKKIFYIRAQNAFIKISKNNNKYLLFDSSENNNKLEKIIFNYVLNKLKKNNV
tara:strand:+ start:605 stop:1243 length:639 start_codon:yes stop_codon:yes gene_type:complete